MDAMNSRLIVAPLALLGLIALSGCASFPNLEQAYDECKTKITPQFDDPSSVVWPESSYSGSGDNSTGEIVVVVDEGSKRTQVSCWVTQTDHGWEVDRYETGDPTDEVVN